jgi:hypothetical protein
VGNGCGQTATRQLDGLADVGHLLSEALALPVSSLWQMTNGYALCVPAGLEAISAHLRSLTPEAVAALAGQLRIGVHRDVEVTDAEGPQRPLVSQAFCSALPVAYGTGAPAHWQAFAKLILQAAYEATLWAAVLNARRGASNVVLLTRLGGGVFGNRDDWIDSAIRQALLKAHRFALKVKLVSYGTPSPEMESIAADFA